MGGKEGRKDGQKEGTKEVRKMIEERNPSPCPNRVQPRTDIAY